MAQFNQQGQHIAGTQINAEHVYLGSDAASLNALTQKIDALIKQLDGDGRHEGTARPAAMLRRAREASAAGDATGAVSWLERAARAAAPIKELARAITSLVELARLA
ncbi:MAG: hypothetical protein FWJ93_09505 [Micromonosporaceae bacterium]